MIEPIKLDEDCFIMLGIFCNDQSHLSKPYWGICALERSSFNQQWGVLHALAGKGKLKTAVKIAIEYPKWTGMNAILCMSKPNFIQDPLKEERELALRSEWIKQVIEVSFIQNEHTPVGHALYAACGAALVAHDQHPWTKEMQEAGRASVLS